MIRSVSPCPPVDPAELSDLSHAAERPLTARIYMSSPDVTQAEEDALVRALRSGWVAPLGPEVDAFEAELAACDRTRRTRSRCRSGTAALHLGAAARSASVPATVVVTSSMTFAATANAITYTGATPVFVDSDETGNLDPALLERGARATSVAPGRATSPPSCPSTCSARSPTTTRVGAVAARARRARARRRRRVPGRAPRRAAGRSRRRRGRACPFNGNKIMTTSGGGALLCDDADMAAAHPLPRHPGAPAGRRTTSTPTSATTTGCPTCWPPWAGPSSRGCPR